MTLDEMRGAYIALVTVTLICSLFMFVVLLIILSFSKQDEDNKNPRDWKYNLDRNSKIFKMQVGIFAVGSFGTAAMAATSLISQAGNSSFISMDGFRIGNLLCTIGFRFGSVLFVIFHFFNYMFLMQKADAANAIPSNPLMGKLLYWSTCCVPLFAIAVAILDEGQFDSDQPLPERTNSDYFCTAHVKWQVSVTFGVMDTLLELGYFIYFILPLRQVLKNFSQLRAALDYKSIATINTAADAEATEKKKRLIAVTARNWVACSMSVVSTIVAVAIVSVGNSEAPVSVRLYACISIPLNMLACGLASLYATAGAWENRNSIIVQKSTHDRASSQGGGKGGSTKLKDPTQELQTSQLATETTK
jgi:hypothetical protein